MTTMESILLGLLVLNALALGVLILLQQGKGADVGAAFGSGAANTMFGSRGSASFLAKLTTWLAIGFFVISFSLAYVAKERAAGLGDQGIPQVPAPAGAADEGEAAADEADPALTAPEEPVDSDVPEIPDV